MMPTPRLDAEQPPEGEDGQGPVDQRWAFSAAAGSGADRVVLSAANVPDAEGITWLLGDIEGWHTTPPAEPALTPLGMTNRSIAAPVFPHEAREFTLHGHVLTGSAEEAEHARQRLYRAFAAYDRTIEVHVTEAVSKRVFARTLEPIETEPLGDRAFAYMIPLICPDPAKYGTVERTGDTDAQIPGELGFTFPITFPLTFTNPNGGGTGRMVLTNAGTTQSYPLSRISGPLTSPWQITNATTGASLTFETSIGARQVLVIDHAARTAQIGSFSVAALAEGQWWPLAPGRNVLRFLSSTYDPAAVWTLTAHDAYL